MERLIQEDPFLAHGQRSRVDHRWRLGKANHRCIVSLSVSGLPVLERYRSMTGARRDSSSWRVHWRLLCCLCPSIAISHSIPTQSVRFDGLNSKVHGRSGWRGARVLRSDAANESRKPQKAERGESKRPKLTTRARFPQSRMTRPLGAENPPPVPALRLASC